MNKIKQFMLVCACGLYSTFALADVTGSWVFSVTLGDLGSGDATISLTQEAEGKLTGTYAGQLANGPVEGTHDGNKFEFAFNSELLGGAITYSGEQKADGSVEGVVSAQGQDIGTFTGRMR